MSQLLRDRSEAHARDYFQQIVQVREHAATALKRNVRDNYTEFIQTSREIAGAQPYSSP